MKSKLKVCIVSAEMAPLAKVGGLADVASSLSRTLATMGHEVSVFLPMYGFINPHELGMKRVRLNGEVRVRLDNTKKPVGLWQYSMRGSKATYYFVENEWLLGRDGVYGDPETRLDYPDNAARFVFFSRAVLDLIKNLSLTFDVIHCNDHQTGLIPLLLKEEYAADKVFSKAATLFTIHNLGYQGVYEREVLAQAGLPEELAYPMGPLEFWGKVNYMKAAIVYSDLISTVSETYAKEIQSDPEYGCGLEGVLKARSEDLFGVLNGADYVSWNPSTDRYLPHKYGPSNLENKAKNKLNLIAKHKLTGLTSESFLMGIVSRLADQKGLNLLASIIEELLAMDVGLAVLGTGQQKYHDFFTELKEKYPGRVSVSLTFNEKLAHLIEAASDVFLMPSRYEPCGLNQMYSMRYGTIPIVRYTGGLADTVKPFDAATLQGTGFVFHDYSAAAFRDAVATAYEVFQNKEQWSTLMRNAMQQDFSWKRAAKGYEELYKKAVGKSSGSPFSEWVCSVSGKRSGL
jgi:starch synthase